MADRRAAEENLDERDGLNRPGVRKLPTMLREYGTYASHAVLVSSSKSGHFLWYVNFGVGFTGACVFGDLALYERLQM